MTPLTARAIRWRQQSIQNHKPMLDSFGRRLENFTRVETFGDNVFKNDPEWDNNNVHWVKVLVDSRTREVFTYQPQIVPANRVAVPAP
jgi:hypothetical protein